MIKLKCHKLKLTIEIVPSTSWYHNLRNRMSKKDWDKIRKSTYAQYRDRCGICRSQGRLNCHEIWEYDDKKHVQKLAGFIALCNMCNFVKHIGLSGILALEGKLDYGEIVKHFMNVNKCDTQTFEKHKERAFDEWRRRSQHEWHVDLEEYKDVIKRDSNKRNRKDQKWQRE